MKLIDYARMTLNVYEQTNLAEGVLESVSWNAYKKEKERKRGERVSCTRPNAINARDASIIAIRGARRMTCETYFNFKLWSGLTGDNGHLFLSLFFSRSFSFQPQIFIYLFDCFHRWIFERLILTNYFFIHFPLLLFYCFYSLSLFIIFSS